MRYGSFLNKQATISIVAPSFGVSGYPYEDRYANAKKKFANLGYRIKESDYLYGITKGRSAKADIRASEFMKHYLAVDSDFVFSVAGGELMLEILPYIDFETLKYAKPKWFMGYSDNTNLTFTLPVICDVAAIYGSNFSSFGMNNWDKSLQDSYDLITGKTLALESYDQYEVEDLSKSPGNALCGYNKTEEVVYQSIREHDEHFQGRIIGGCLDVLEELCGTPFDKVDSFLEKYKADGFIWFLEACDLNVFGQRRALFQLKQNGWFKYCRGIIYGRAVNSTPLFDYQTVDLLKDSFLTDDIPVVYGCDFGHLPPSWAIIAGSIAHFDLVDNKARISFELR
ncbi:MAG: S66 peptidase family protein [Erysipelotrichaceae bacterium]